MSDDMHDLQDDDITIDPEADLGDGEATPEMRLKKLRDEVKKVRTERDEHLAGWQRAKADYINLQKRMRESGEELSRAGVMALATDIIAVFDSLEAAARGTDALGIEAVKMQLSGVLERHGIVRVAPALGEQFNPSMHEGVQVVATDKKEEDNTIATVLQSGFTYEGTTLRPARVAVYHSA